MQISSTCTLLGWLSYFTQEIHSNTFLSLLLHFIFQYILKIALKFNFIMFILIDYGYTVYLSAKGFFVLKDCHIDLS